MTRTVLVVLALVLGAALAEEATYGEARVDPTVTTLKVSKAGLLGPMGGVFELAVQIVILIALILLISTLKSSSGDIFGSLYGKGGDEYEYYELPAHSGSSSYASGYSKRSVDTPSSFMDLPIVQKLTERVTRAIESYEG